MRLLLILTIFFSLTQLVSAERWRGLIASVAALESAKEQVPENLEPKPEPEAVSVEKVNEDKKESVRSSSTTNTKTRVRLHLHLFKRKCLSCR